MRFSNLIIPACAIAALSGCFSSEITLELPDNTTKAILFYTGSDNLADLLIVDGQNYFGKAQYQIDDPMGDIGFRLETGERVQAECIKLGKNFIDEDECKLYEVYRSSFDPIPVGTKTERPSMF